MGKEGGNRAALLAGARRCLEDRGYAQTTARDLVAASGTNLGAIGYHFGSKEALLNEALAEGVRHWIGRIGELAGAEPDGGNALAVSTRQLFDLLAAHRPIAVAYLEAWVQAAHRPAVRRQLAAQYREFRTATAALLEGLTEQNSSQQDLDRSAMASLLIALVDGLTVQWLLEPGEVPDPERLADAAAALPSLLDR